MATRFLRERMFMVEKSNLLRIAVAVIASVILTVMFKYWLETMAGEGPPLLFFLPGVIVGGFVGGFWLGALTTLLSSVVSMFFFLHPTLDFAVSSPNDQVRLAIFLISGLLISYLFERLRVRGRELAARTEELKRSNAELENFAAVASHDLKEPLRVVTSYVQMVAQRNHERLDPESREYIEIARAGARRMARLIDSLLQYSKAGSGPVLVEKTDLNQVLAHVALNLQSQIRETGTRLVVAPMPAFHTSGPLLEQLFQNLIANAIKYRGTATPQVTVGVRHEPRGHRRHEWIFSVADNGIGIAPEATVRIFELFHRLNARPVPGAGIGLATCARIVDRLHGRIWVESQPGIGSTFFFTLPDPGGFRNSGAKADRRKPEPAPRLPASDAF